MSHEGPQTLLAPQEPMAMVPTEEHRTRQALAAAGLSLVAIFSVASCGQQQQPDYSDIYKPAQPAGDQAPVQQHHVQKPAHHPAHKTVHHKVVHHKAAHAAAPAPRAHVHRANAPLVLGFGSHGSAVTKVQQNLYRIGCGTGVDDGIYGHITGTAVKDFQRNNHLYVDGKAGPTTMTALKQAVHDKVRNCGGAPPAPAPFYKNKTPDCHNYVVPHPCMGSGSGGYKAPLSGSGSAIPGISLKH